MYTVRTVCQALFCSVRTEPIDSSMFHDNPLNTYLPLPYVTEGETGAVRRLLNKVSQLVSTDNKVASREGVSN